MDNNLREEIIQIIHTVLRTATDLNDISDNDHMVSSGLLSSLQIVELASMLEKKFGIDFSLIDFNVYDFESIASIEALIVPNRKQS